MTDEQAIRDLISTWMRATRENDLATVLNLMADDVMFMVPGQEPFGKDAFAESSASMTNVQFDGRSEIKELQILGNWAYVRTYIDLTVNRDGAPSVHRAGYTLTIMRKQPDGRWLLARDANLMVTK
jgi:uncharacterized protein (TIGR02246 family)